MRKRMKPSPSSAGHHHHSHQEERGKQHREEDDDDEEGLLIGGLPNHVAHLVLSKLPPRLLFSVCSSWRRFLYSPLFPPFLSLYALLNPASASISAVNPVEFMSFDPISSRWSPFPPPPSPPLRLLLRHPSFISRSLPIQTLSVSGHLVLLAATTAASSDHHDLFPLPHPLVFSPLSQSWSHGPPLSAPRRWCAAGTLAGSVFVASGIGSQFSSEVARSFERWDLSTSDSAESTAKRKECWEKLGRLKDGRFSREAIDAVGCRGKLWMVNVKGDAAKEGAVYDVREGAWSDMPEAMIVGWKGPAAAMDEEEIYAVDERKGVLRRYDFGMGAWVEVLDSPALRGAQQIAAAGGRVCLVGGKEIVVVDVTSPGSMWVVETPPGYQSVAVHVLPRTAKSGVVAVGDRVS